jgi:hypothetical protein
MVTRADRQAGRGTEWMPDPARSTWIERRGRIGFTMSTQRRVSRVVSAMRTNRAELRCLTAPFMSIVWLAWAWLLCGGKTPQQAAVREATNSLLSDHHNETLAQLDNRSWSPPPGWVGVRSTYGLRVTQRSSLRQVPRFLPSRAHLHTTLPIAPAGEVRWAERHDGKRDLYFQHAA